MGFGETLKKIRKKHNDSFYTLATKLGVAHSYVSKIEKENKVSEKVFKKLIEIYKADEDELSLSYLEEIVPDIILDKLVYKNDKLTFSVPTMKAQKFKTYILASNGDGSLLSQFEIRELIIPMGLIIKKNSFCIEIQGTDLEPDFYEGDTLLIEETTEKWQELNKKIVVVEKDGERYIRKIGIIDYEPNLFSLNNVYPPFKVTDEVKIVGEVVSLLARNLKKIRF